MAKGDWKRIAGRRFENLRTGEVLSRRQYDKRVGALRSYGSYERKAKQMAEESLETAVLRPARGRKSFIKASEYERAEVASKRIEAREAKRINQKFQKSLSKLERKGKAKKEKIIYPKMRSTKTWTFEVDWDGMVDFQGNLDKEGVSYKVAAREFWMAVEAARSDHNTVALMLGMYGVDENTGGEMAYWSRGLFDKHMRDGTIKGFLDDALTSPLEKSYFYPVGFIVGFYRKPDVTEKERDAYDLKKQKAGAWRSYEQDRKRQARIRRALKKMG